MNLTKLFKTQAELDKKIIEEKGLQGQDLLDKKILALQVELGELANEWRGFKFWSEDQESNVLSYKCSECGFTSKENIDCPLADEHYEFYMIGFNPLLEEYVDCLHFILSIGLEKGFDKLALDFKSKKRDITRLFIQINIGASTLIHLGGDHENNYKLLVSQFFKLGELLGFTWEQIEQAYYQKNEINHERQSNGY